MGRLLLILFMAAPLAAGCSDDSPAKSKDGGAGAGGTSGSGGAGGTPDATTVQDAQSDGGPGDMQGADVAMMPPSISIMAPGAGAVVLGNDADKSVAVTLSVSNFTLKAPGACAGAANCGHVHLLIDQQACNAPGAPYNNAGADSTITAKFAYCATSTGPHVITLQLHNDDHSPVRDGAGAVVHSQHQKVLACAAGTPCLAITEPLMGSTVNLGGDADRGVAVAFSVQGFTLKAPGGCGGDAKCGHLHLNVDGDACNAMGAPYNNAGAASPMPAKMALCGEPTGAHRVTLALHKDDHSAVKDAVGNPVDASTWFTAVAAGAPALSLASHWGSSVQIGTDTDKTVPFDFVVRNFVLKAPGMCAGASGCGHVHLLVDGEACNDTGAPYNNAGAASPIRAKLARCATPTGPHTATLELHNDDHSAVKDAAGRVVSAHTAFGALPADNTPAISIDWPSSGAVVMAGTDADKSVPVFYAVQNFVLKAPGSCGGTANCGHIHLNVDGNACNAMGAPYNNAGAAGPTAARLALCPVAAGSHTFVVALHKDDHSPVTAAAAAVRAEVDVTVCHPDKPCIAVVLPSPRATIGLGTDAGKSIPVDYVVNNFRLKGPGTCAGAAKCGHVHLLVDEMACNAMGAPYNNAGAMGPTAARLAQCAMPTGSHKLSVQLHNDDHSATADAERSEVKVVTR